MRRERPAANATNARATASTNFEAHKCTTSPTQSGHSILRTNPSTSCYPCPSCSPLSTGAWPGLPRRHAVVTPWLSTLGTHTCANPFLCSRLTAAGMYDMHTCAYGGSYPCVCGTCAALRPRREPWRGPALRTRPWPAPLALRPGTWRRPP